MFHNFLTKNIFFRTYSKNKMSFGEHILIILNCFFSTILKNNYININMIQ